jgi:hypothetical protein
MKLTPEIVVAFWKHMQSKYQFEVINKAKASEMKAVAKFLGRMGIMDADTFMKRYATTIGNRVYIPFEIGTGDLISQVCLCVHETQHTVQFDRNPIKFAALYCASSAGRAHYEADAMTTDMEMTFFLTGRVLDPVKNADRLKAYAVSEADIKVVRKHLKAVASFVKDGGVVSGTSKTAIAWLKKNVG